MWLDNIKSDVKGTEIKDVDWFDLAQDVERGAEPVSRLCNGR
jgi:hypothetical protein